MEINWSFLLQLLVVIGGWISIYVNTQTRIVKLEEKQDSLKQLIEFHEGGVKDLKIVIKENTEAINKLQIELSKLNTK